MTASILLICRANLCRSPSAEVMLSRALGGVHVDASVTSAGMEVVAGQAAPEDFVEIALVRGIDLRAHQPTAFSEDAAASWRAGLALLGDADHPEAAQVRAKLADLDGSFRPAP